MSTDLLLAMLEFPLTGDPDWTRARQALAELTDESLLGDVRQHLLDTSDAPTASELRAAATRGLDLLKTMWEGDDASATVRPLSASRVLAFGGLSCGDEPFEGYAQALFAIELGLAEAAGFR